MSLADQAVAELPPMPYMDESSRRPVLVPTN